MTSIVGAIELYKTTYITRTIIRAVETVGMLAFVVVKIQVVFIQISIQILKTLMKYEVYKLVVPAVSVSEKSRFYIQECEGRSLEHS